jgi:hypothetical protein
VLGREGRPEGMKSFAVHRGEGPRTSANPSGGALTRYISITIPVKSRCARESTGPTSSYSASSAQGIHVRVALFRATAAVSGPTAAVNRVASGVRPTRAFDSEH